MDLLLAKGLRVRILNLPEKLDPDDFVRKHGREVYDRLLAKAPYFWQYLMNEATQRFDMADPAMKANAVKDVLPLIGQIQDRVERLEVAKAVAEGFKVPEPVLFEQLKLTPGRHEPKPRVSVPKVLPHKVLGASEKQLIHALIQNVEICRQIAPFVEGLTDVWSFPVITGLVQTPGIHLEDILRSVEDEELQRQVRAAVAESFGRVTFDQAFSSVCTLQRDANLVKEDRDIGEQLKKYEGAEGAPQEFLKRKMEIALKKSQITALKP
jgi:DNA primase